MIRSSKSMSWPSAWATATASRVVSLTSALECSLALSSPAVIPVSAAEGKVAALRISFFQISGRTEKRNGGRESSRLERLSETPSPAAAVGERADQCRLLGGMSPRPATWSRPLL